MGSHLILVSNHVSQPLVVDHSEKDVRLQFTPIHTRVHSLCAVVVISSCSRKWDNNVRWDVSGQTLSSQAGDQCKSKKSRGPFSKFSTTRQVGRVYDNGLRHLWSKVSAWVSRIPSYALQVTPWPGKKLFSLILPIPRNNYWITFNVQPGITIAKTIL